MNVFKGLFSSLSIAVLFIVSFNAIASDDVLAPLKAIYQNDMQRELDPFSKRLVELQSAAIKRSQELDSPVAGLDFDYAINGQDFEPGLIASVVFDIKNQTESTAEVIATFENFDTQTLEYSLVKEDGGWLVDDVKCLSPECDWVLTALYEEGAKQAE